MEAEGAGQRKKVERDGDRKSRKKFFSMMKTKFFFCIGGERERERGERER